MSGNTEKTGAVVNNQEILRDSNGRFIKGTPCPGPGRPRGSKGGGFRQRLNELVGDDSREIALKLCEIAFYDQKQTKDRWPKYKANEVLKALELILKYKEKVPEQDINISTPESRKISVEFIEAEEDK